MSTQKHLSGLRKKLSRSIENLDASSFIAAAEQLVELSAYEWELVERSIRLSEILVRRFDPQRIKTRRSAFFEALMSHLTSVAPHAVKKFRRSVVLGVKLERVHSTLNACMERHIATLPGQQISSRLIALMWQVWRSLPQVVIRDPALNSLGLAELEIDGYTVDLDGAVESALLGFGDLFKNIAFRERSTESDDGIKLKLDLTSLTTPSKQEQASLLFLTQLAVGRVQWTECEQRVRYYDGTINCHQSKFQNKPCRFVRVKVKLPKPAGLFQIARRRLSTRWAELYHRVSMAEPHVAPTQLPPLEYWDREELVSALLLAQEFGLEKLDATDFAGLTLGEWLRGYKVLRQLWRRSPTPQPVARQVITSTLVMHGLPSVKADLFLDHVTFKVKSQDLFENPILTTNDDTYIPVTPALDFMNLPVIIYSRISRERQPRGSVKGKRFEKLVVALFQQNGVACHGFKEAADGDEYEFDAVVDWGRYLFVFEAKCRSVPGPWAALEYQFEVLLEDAIGQVKRLKKFLCDHPEIVRDRFSRDVPDEDIIPCVLFSCTIGSLPLDGVGVSDFSWLQRFFESAGVSKTEATENGLKTVELHRIWDGSSPTADDLKRHIETHFPYVLWSGVIEEKLNSPPVPIDDSTRLQFDRISFRNSDISSS